MASVLKPKEYLSSGGAEGLAARMMAMTNPVSELRSIPPDQLQDAPDGWNFFKPLPPAKYFELLQSIEENGLLVPLIVWERPQVGYLVLSGHNRKRAVQALYQETRDERFATLPCRVYRADELTEEQARGILIDCNWVQRVLTPAERARAIRYKYVELGRQERGSGRRGYDVVAEHFGLRATQVYQYNRLASLEPEWLDKLDAGEISIKAAAHLSGLRSEQRALMRDVDKLDNRVILQVEACFDQDETRRALLKTTEPAQKELRMMVPAAQYDAIVALVERYLSDGGNDRGDDQGRCSRTPTTF